MKKKEFPLSYNRILGRKAIGKKKKSILTAGIV
jgi:hypothetical protein